MNITQQSSTARRTLFTPRTPATAPHRAPPPSSRLRSRVRLGGGPRAKRRLQPQHKSSLPNLTFSSGEDTSELIDESELCIRSSIDLLLNDGHYSPIGLEYEYERSSRAVTSGWGSPFIPRRASDLRLVTRAKCILPGGAVELCMMEGVDERRETLTVRCSRGRVYGLKLGKVVYAWR